MTNTQVLNMFMRATADNICRTYSCEYCHETYGFNSCPNDILVDNDDVCVFVSKVVKLLREWDEDMHFSTNITDDELVSLLKDAVTVEE